MNEIYILIKYITNLFYGFFRFYETPMLLIFGRAAQKMN